ncbi:MFS transporter [Corynebacterium epidermidicanis]|uniref:Arabinose efflux permease family protein n=1 Tax=Corynebacterium epidermidicanis TaxID=1050174 RepID=A0A0G3GNW6_9CORY|nr:MFS transporter [Corynebacterium epidermidicanis]AKK02844.1 arabinose efflux permease family protein [Corynebacterium epidermidicanis]
MSTPQTPPHSKIPYEIWVLVSAAFIVALGYGIIAPIIPQFARSFDVSVAAAGAVISVFAASRLLFAPASGMLVDKLGSRRTYMAGLLVVAATTGSVAFAQEYWHILALRFVGGVGSTMFTVSAMGFVVRYSPPDIRGRASSAYASAFLIGNVLGPVLGALVEPLGMRTPFLIYGAALFVATAVVGVMLRPGYHGPEPVKVALPTLSVKDVWRHPSYQATLLSGFANGWMNFGVRVAILPLFAASIFHRGGAIAGLAMAAFALGSAIALQFSGRLADTIGRKPLIVAGLIVNLVFTGMLGFSTSTFLLIAFSLLAGVGGGLMNPAQQATLADIIGNEHSGGKVLANFQMAQDLGAILGPILVGMLADVYGYQFAFLSCSAVALVVALVWIVHGQETLVEASGRVKRVKG